MADYPKIEFRCPPELEEEVFEILAKREFQELEVTKSRLLRISVILGFQIIKSNPNILKDIKEKDFFKAYK